MLGKEEQHKRNELRKNEEKKSQANWRGQGSTLTG